MKDTLSPYRMNLPIRLRGRIEAAAEANRRSMSKEIITTLEEAYPAPPDPADLTARCALAAHLLKRLYQDGEISFERYQADSAAVVFRLGELGFEGGGHELARVSLDEALRRGTATTEGLRVWIAETRQAFEDRFGPVLAGVRAPSGSTAGGGGL